MILLLLILLILSILIFSYLIATNNRRDKKKEENIFIRKQSNTPRYLYRLYLFSNSWILTKRLIKKIKRRYKILLPGEKKKIGEKSAKIFLIIMSLWFVLVLVLAIIKPNLYTVIASIAIVYFTSNEIIIRQADKLEKKILEQFIKFTEKVRHNYYARKPIEDSIYDALEEADYEISLHGSAIYEILTSMNIEEEIVKYADTAPNHFFNTFLSLCVTTIQKGDKKINGQSLFLANLLNLKSEVLVEILKLEQINYRFSGLILTALFPMFFLQAIEEFGVSNIPELSSYYNGIFGIFTSLLIFASTLFSYSMINKLKENYHIEVKEHPILERIANIKPISGVVNSYLNRNYGKTLEMTDTLKLVGESTTPKQFLVKRILYSVGTFIFCVVLFLVIHNNNRENILTDVTNVMSSAATQKQQEELKDAIIRFTDKYKKTNVTVEEVEKDLFAEGIIRNKQLMTITAEEIVSRAKEYRNEYFKWYELLIAFVLSGIAYYIPYFALYYQKRIKQLSMEEEVAQFQAIIIMLMHIENITILNILEWLETFAEVFKQSIQECINDFPSSDINALENLKIKEPYEPFGRIVDDLLMCDSIGVERAFDEIEVERNNYQDKRKQENEIYIHRKSVKAMILAYTPLTLTIGLYLIVPFVVEAFSQFLVYINQMQSIY